MTRYAAMFERVERAGEAALGAFVMLGDPTPDRCAEYLDALVEGGADMLELGIPFSDPVADGPVIQAASVRARAAGVRTADCLRLIEGARRRHPEIPIGILTYANIVAALGIEAFCRALADAGADSLLVADVPTIEADPYVAATRLSGIDLVMIVAPNTGDDALARIAEMSSGYTYCVARAGVTGHGEAPKFDHRAIFERLRVASAPPPVLGFGIGRPEQVRAAVAEGAAGVIAGSAIVERIGGEASPTEIAAFVRSLKGATAKA